MAGIGELLGENGAIQQLFMWQVVGQIVTTLMSPAFNSLQQDVLKQHPNVVITPDVLARAVTQTFMDKAAAAAEAERSGLDESRFGILLKLAEVRLTPADLATAVLRSYVDHGEAVSEARLQGVTSDRFDTLTLLAGDGIGPEQAATALRRGYIEADGKGPDSTSYRQAIAESRLHDKWADVLYELTRAVLSPPDAAEAVVRGFLDRAEGEAWAALNGVGVQQFTIMTRLAGDAPSPTELAEALRRGVIPYDSGSPDVPGFLQGIREGRLADQWAPMLRALSQMWPTPTDALEARLVGQVTTDESQRLYERFGGDPQYWQFMFDTRGESPTPVELGLLANRGYIAWDGTGSEKTTFAQGFREGRSRDKWQDAYRKLAQYVPPESTVSTLLSHGALTDDDAADLLAKQGMDKTLITAYIKNAHIEALSDYRGATVTLVLQAYYQQLIKRDDTVDILKSLHVTDAAANLMLEYEDMQRAFAAINNAVSRTRSLYAARKITLKTAQASLHTLGIPPDQATDILESWQLENSISVKTLTESQIADAFADDLITYAEALVELGNIGYTAFDAWVILSIKVKQPLPDKPPQGPAPMQDAVTAGTT